MLSPWKILGTLDCCCTGMPQLTKRCPLSPWYAAAPRSRERSTNTRRRQDESIGSLKAMKTCKYQFFNRMPEKLKKIPIPLRHIQKYCLLERDGNSQTPKFYIFLSIISNHTNSTFFACFSNPSVWERHQSWEKVGLYIINNVSYGRLVGQSCKCCPLQGVVNCKCSPLWDGRS